MMAVRLRNSLGNDLSHDHRMGFSSTRSRTAVVSWERGRISPYRGYSSLVLGCLMLVICVPFAQAALLRVPRNYPTIQAGITAASAEDTVLVAPGIYVESIIMKSGVQSYGEPGAILDGSQVPAGTAPAPGVLVDVGCRADASEYWPFC